MKSLSTLLASAALVLAAGPAIAEGLIRQLPEDGAWAKYHATVSFVGGEGRSRDVSGALTLRSVGEETVDGKAARWIELELELQTGQGEGRDVLKLLVPEEQLKQGGRPLEHIVRGWQRPFDGGVRQVSSADDLSRSLSRQLLRAPLDDPKPIEKKTVQFQSGRLECEGIAGTFTSPSGEFTFEGQASLWTHESVPFGVAALRHEGKALRSGAEVFRLTLDLSLEETGTGARSALPDRN